MHLRYLPHALRGIYLKIVRYLPHEFKRYLPYELDGLNVRYLPLELMRYLPKEHLPHMGIYFFEVNTSYPMYVELPHTMR